MKISILPIIIILLTFLSCSNQRNTISQMEESKNPLLCEPKNGACEVKNTSEAQAVKLVQEKTQKAITVTYFTDPICSSCWGIEPQLRKMKLEYGDVIDINYRMGGLLPDWSYNSGGISKPSDVAGHWDEVSPHYNMPIDGDVWLEDPLDSSYPPSIAFKAAQLQGEKKAQLFLRRIREMVFLEKKNITKWEHLSAAAEQSGIDANALKNAYEAEAKKLFDEDLTYARAYGVRGFPTLFFADKDKNQFMVYGAKPYAHFENAINKLFSNVKKTPIQTDWQSMFQYHNSYTVREFSEVSNRSLSEGKSLLEDLAKQGKVRVTSTKNGNLYTLK